MLTELVNTLVTVLGQNAANATPAIPLRIPFANTKGEEGLPPQEGGNIVASEAQADTDACQRRARRKRRTRHESRGNAPELHAPEHTRDSVFNRLKQTRPDPNLDDGYDSEYERLVGSKKRIDLRTWLNARRAQHEQQAESRPPVRATPEEESLSQMQAQIDLLLAKRNVPNLVREVLSET